MVEDFELNDLARGQLVEEAVLECRTHGIKNNVLGSDSHRVDLPLLRVLKERARGRRGNEVNLGRHWK